MAEIRANREYKFKEFCISEEIPKSPPIKTKRWTFHDTNPDGRFYNRTVQRKWDEQDLVNGSGDTNINQQFAKPYKKPESDLRAEFFNAYKKYYRRVDIKRLEVQSTLNVDAKFKGVDESVEGESSLYKEKECMEINIVMDTEKDDALVSGKVSRTVLSVSPGEEEPFGKESVRQKRMAVAAGSPEQPTATTTDQNNFLGEIIIDESVDCPLPARSNSFSASLPIVQQQKHISQEHQPNMTSRLKKEQSSMNRTFVPSVRMAKNGNNIDSKPEKKLSQRSGDVSLINHQGFEPDLSNDIIKKTNLSESDKPTCAHTSLKQMEDVGNTKVAVVDEVIPKDEKNEYTKILERTFFNSKIKPNTKNPVNPMSFKFRNLNEKSTRSEVFQNKKTNFKHVGHINCEDVARGSEPDEYDFDTLNFDNSGPNPPSDGYEFPPSAAKSFNTDYHSRGVDLFGPKSNPDEMLNIGEPLRKHHTKKSDLNDYNLEQGTTELVKGQDKNHNITVSIFRTESAQNPTGIKTFQGHSSDSASGVRFRGIRGGPFIESNKNVLKSLVVNVKNGPDHGRHVMKREYKGFTQKQEPDLTQRHNIEEVRNLGSKNIAPTWYEISDFRSSSQVDCCGPSYSSYGKLEEPETFQNIIKGGSNDSKNFCCKESPFTSARSENIETPFVIWTNKSDKATNESLEINKLTISGNDSDAGYDYNNDSDAQSFSDQYIVREISNGSKIQLNKHHQNYPQRSEKLMGKSHLKEVFRNGNGIEGNVNERNRNQRQFSENRYSNKTSVRCNNFAIPNYSSYDKSSRTIDGCCVREDPEKEIYQAKVAISFDEDTGWLDESRGDVSQRHCTEGSFEKKSLQDRPRHNGCLVQENPVTERVPKRYDKDTTTYETNRMRNNEEERKTKYSKHIPIEQSNINIYESNCGDKNITKSSSSDYLEIGPTYSVHYAPAHKKQFRRDRQKHYVEICEAEEMDDRRHGGSANTIHCNHANAANMMCRKQNERLFGTVCNNLPILHCDNYLNGCGHERICKPCYKTNSAFNACEFPNDSRCDCNDFNRGSSILDRLLKNNNVCSCHARDSNLHCHGPNDYNCQMANNHPRYISFPCMEGRNCCLVKECSLQFQKPNNPHCSCPRCSNEIRINVASTRNENYCGACSGDELENSYLLRFDGQRKWMSTGHQPVRNDTKCTTKADKERSGESSSRDIIPNNNVNQQLRKDFGNHCPLNLSRHDNPNYPHEFPISGDDTILVNNPYYCNKQVENVFQPPSAEREKVRNLALKDTKTGPKYYRNSAESEGINFNFSGNVNYSSNQNESIESVAKSKPEKNVHILQETKQLTNVDNNFIITAPSDTNETKGTEEPLEVPDRPSNEPLFLSDEQWDSDDGLPIRRVIRKRNEKTEEKVRCSFPGDEPIYLREELWESGNEEREEKNLTPRNIPSTSAYYLKTTWYGKSFADSNPARRNGNLVRRENRKFSSVHAVIDPSFHCEERWTSGEERCEDHKLQSTLPKNVTRRRKGKRRSYNPRRWDMVTDLPKNGYRNVYEEEEENYQDDNLEDRKCNSNNEQ